jgi:hypothetical protein
MNHKTLEDSSAGQASVTFPGKVEKIIPAVVASRRETAQVAIEGADELYKELRVENKLQDNAGNSVSLKKDAEVEVTITADSDATEPKE